MTKTNSMRESNFELLRLVAMFFIVIYHMFLFFLSPIDDNPLYVAIQLPLHIGVPLFVMISGYFGIKFSPKGLFKLLAKTFVLAVPLMLAYCLWQHQGIKEMVKSLLFISHTPFWFIRSYIMLFLVAPVVNHYLENITPTRRLYLMLALGWIAVYLGTVGGDSSLAGGKNLANFLFLYCLGNCVSHCELTSFKKMGGVKWLCLWIVANLLLVAIYIPFHGSLVGKGIFRLFYSYCGPGMILNALLLFMAFKRFSFRSGMVNYIASSCFAIYLLHHAYLVLYGPIQASVLWVYRNTGNQLSLVLGLVALTLVIMAACIAVDKLFTPVWKSSAKIGDWLNGRLGGYKYL